MPTLRSLRLSALVATCPVALFAQTGASFDPSLDLDQHVYQSWSLEDGLPHNAVTAITQTRDGYLWLGTQGWLGREPGSGRPLRQRDRLGRASSLYRDYA
jgi:hypothetical protein